jgi:hypothetical protein
MTNQRKTVEGQRLDEAREQECRGNYGGRTSASANGARSARITVRTAMQGTISPTTGPLACLSLGEDGLAGISDDHQRLCFALALWNGKDPIHKERLFGLTNSEGNHG